MRSITSALVDLSDLSSDDIANLMLQKGIKGVPGEPTSCPLSRYLSGESGGIHTVVGTSTISQGGTLHLLSFEIQEFIQRFDREEFPNLLEKG